MLNSCIWNRTTQTNTSGLRVSTANESWNKPSRHKILMPCEQCLNFIWHSYRLYLNTVTFHGRRGGGAPGFRPPMLPLRLWPSDLRQNRNENHSKTPATRTLSRSFMAEVFVVLSVKLRSSRHSSLEENYMTEHLHSGKLVRNSILLTIIRLWVHTNKVTGRT